MKMHTLGNPKSGRSGDVVFFMIRNRKRTLTPLPRLRPLPKPRPTANCLELWDGG
jgi:hypothetical protein